MTAPKDRRPMTDEERELVARLLKHPLFGGGLATRPFLERIAREEDVADGAIQELRRMEAYAGD